MGVLCEAENVLTDQVSYENRTPSSKMVTICRQLPGGSRHDGKDCARKHAGTPPRKRRCPRNWDVLQFALQGHSNGCSHGPLLRSSSALLRSKSLELMVDPDP